MHDARSHHRPTARGTGTRRESDSPHEISVMCDASPQVELQHDGIARRTGAVTASRSPQGPTRRSHLPALAVTLAPVSPTSPEAAMARTAKKGFTLIELLIVVVIIGILAA